MNGFRRGFLAVSRVGYEGVVRPLLFRASAQAAHHQLMRALTWLDFSPPFDALLAGIHRLAFERHEVEVGGVRLPYPLMLAAGMVKGEGFQGEAEALAAVQQGRNIIPGWRSVPRLVGLVEFGSFTRYPRLGNSGVVIWRDEQTQSTQNRVGLRNPGALAAAAFLANHRNDLPSQYGINIAASPGVNDLEQQQAEVVESVDAFLNQNLRPAWFTLNVSCPNTEDDPTGRQTEAQTRELCGAVMERIDDIPLWVKISPGLAPEQYRILMRVFHELGVRAVIATNTLGQPAPDDPTLTAGVGGGRLHSCALEAARLLIAEKARGKYAVDVVGCGGVLDGATYRMYLDSGVSAVQYWSALVYRGPLAAAIIQCESRYAV